ncbi:MAG: DUF262 domain-containing protein [Planctomycetota bacterium]|nr:DUF262 domain-containing protein [Planctomycetota bacterium]
MTLQDEILKESAQIKTDSYPMSVGELLNLYRDGELDIHPEFQRVYRWTAAQKTRLIESILLGIPVPPIFVAQREDGVWDVVDGVQRLSTIFQFLGEYLDEKSKKVSPLVLEKTKFLPSLGGKTWSGDDPFTKQQQLYVKRAKVDMKIVLKESNDKSKYELFMRLNTGGTVLEPQEVRNCLMIMAYPSLYDWIRDLSKDGDFSSAIALPEGPVQEQYPMELVTRFLTFRTFPEKQLGEVGDIGDFLNDKLETLFSLGPERREIETRAFRETFQAINRELQDDAFRRFSKVKNRFLGAFSIACFEVVALGIGFNTQADGSLKPIDGLTEKIKGIWDAELFQNNSGSGVRASVRIPRIVPMGRKLFAQ